MARASFGTVPRTKTARRGLPPPTTSSNRSRGLSPSTTAEKNTNPNRGWAARRTMSMFVCRARAVPRLAHRLASGRFRFQEPHFRSRGRIPLRLASCRSKKPRANVSRRFSLPAEDDQRGRARQFAKTCLRGESVRANQRPNPQTATDDELLKRILANWRARQDRTKSFRYAWNTRSVIKGGRRTLVQDLRRALWIAGDNRFRF